MAKRPSPTNEDASPNSASLIAEIGKRLRKRKERKYQESLEDMGMFKEGGGRANVPMSTDKNYMDAPKKKSTGGKMRSADGIAIKGKTRLSMKGYGRNE